jgi:hypothetical protein
MPEYLSKTQPVDTTPPAQVSVGPPPQKGGGIGPSKTRLALAFMIAATSDAVSYVTELVPPVQWTVDLMTAHLLFMILGWQWVL